MRIVGGTWRGRPLAHPKTDAIRPTSDRVREALFNILSHDTSLPSLKDARVIDVFAGSGALGLEALYRGAAFCLFVENGADARGLIRTNVEAFGAQGITKLYRRDATRLGPIGTLAPFDFAFLDPPYDKGLTERALASLAAGEWLNNEVVVVVEEHADAEVVFPDPFQLHDQRKYGDTQVLVARYKPVAITGSNTCDAKKDET